MVQLQIFFIPLLTSLVKFLSKFSPVLFQFKSNFGLVLVKGINDHKGINDVKKKAYGLTDNKSIDMFSFKR